VRPLAWAVGLTVLGSLGGVLVARALLVFNDRTRDRLVRWLARDHHARTVKELLLETGGIGTVVVMSTLVGGD
jgi:hypothetical protein